MLVAGRILAPLAIDDELILPLAWPHIDDHAPGAVAVIVAHGGGFGGGVGPAVELSRDLDPPFFGMGEQGFEVDIWMWKSERQADLEPTFQELDKIYLNIGIDSYPNLLRSPLEQPTRNALTLESDPDFVTGWGAGNIVSDPTRGTPAEDLVAQGFGTLKARPPVDQRVAATGTYSLGSYRLVFKRTLSGGQGRVSLTPGETALVSFAVWNGSAGDRDGKKSITIWQELNIAPWNVSN